MKKIIGLIVILAVSSGYAADSMFFGSGATGADIVITKGDGTIQAQDVLISVETNATITLYRARVSAKATVASTGTTITIPTTATNTVGGVVITASGDYVIIGDQLRDISVVTPAAGGLSTVLTVTSAATVGLNEPVYIVDAGDNLTASARTTWGNTTIPFLFQGFNNAPAAISVPSTAGATMVSGRAVRR